MATPVPKNVAAALGLVPTVLGGVRRLPTKAVQLPVMALGTALSGLDAARREYDELADRGEKLLARLRGGSLELLEDSVDSVLGTSTDNAKQAADAAAKRSKEQAEADKAVQQTLPVDEPAPAAKAEAPEPKTEAPAATKVDSAATAEVVAQVEKVAANVLSHMDGDTYELPLEDYDGMTLGALRGRLRSLDMQQLVVLRDYEKAKAHRLPVITMLDNRIAKLSSGESTPTGSTPDTPSDKASTETKPPKNVGATAAAKNSPAPPHTKVRIT